MRNMLFKRLVAVVTGMMIAFTAVVATDVTTAQAAEIETLYASSDVETAMGGVERKHSFTVGKSGELCGMVGVLEPVDFTITLYNSAGNQLELSDNPYRVSANDPGWVYNQAYGRYFYLDIFSLGNGDYFYGITFGAETNYILAIEQGVEEAKISEPKATVTRGFTKKLSVTGAKVTKWSSSKKSVATVDSKGKVTAKKEGKTTISAECENGQKVKCVVTVKANKYSKTRPTTSDVPYGSCAMSAYSASFDSKGNLVIKTRFVNNDYYKTTALENIKIVVRDGNGKLVGQYKARRKSVSAPSHSTKDMSFTINKANLKKKKADLRNCTIKCAGEYIYYY